MVRLLLLHGHDGQRRHQHEELDGGGGKKVILRRELWVLARVLPQDDAGCNQRAERHAGAQRLGAVHGVAAGKRPVRHLRR